MDFMEAAKAMKEGKDVKMSDSTGTLVLHIDCDIIKDNTNSEYAVSHNQIMSDWEIVEEKKAWSLNPEWIKKNYPDTYELIRKSEIASTKEEK